MQILDYPWHQVHAYRLHALSAEFTFLEDVRPLLWNIAQRPMPDNFKGGISRDDVKPGTFDLALLHLDQWCAMMNLRAQPYRVMRLIAQNNAIPQVVIMHGTPDNEKNRQEILALVGDLPVVCNSHQAAREWDAGEDREDEYGLPQFRSIIHGYNVDEFWSYPCDERRHEVFTVCSGGNISRAYHGIPLLERVKRKVPVVWYGTRGDMPWLPDYHSYREMLASSLIYFSPTRRAPMPGARTEAMLSGCCIVTMAGQDADEVISHGDNGFVMTSYQDAVDALGMLLAAPKVAWRIGQVGRAFAREMFQASRYVNDWTKLLGEIGVIFW